MDEHQKIILPVPREVISSRKTFLQMSREIGLFFIKNPKWFLEWMLVGLVGKLMMSGELTFEVIRKFVK